MAPRGRRNERLESVGTRTLVTALGQHFGTAGHEIELWRAGTAILARSGVLVAPEDLRRYANSGRLRASWLPVLMDVLGDFRIQPADWELMSDYLGMSLTEAWFDRPEMLVKAEVLHHSVLPRLEYLVETVDADTATDDEVLTLATATGEVLGADSVYKRLVSGSKDHLRLVTLHRMFFDRFAARLDRLEDSQDQSVLRRLFSARERVEHNHPVSTATDWDKPSIDPQQALQGAERQYNAGTWGVKRMMLETDSEERRFRVAEVRARYAGMQAKWLIAGGHIDMARDIYEESASDYAALLQSSVARTDPTRTSILGYQIAMTAAAIQRVCGNCDGAIECIEQASSVLEPALPEEHHERIVARAALALMRLKPGNSRPSKYLREVYSEFASRWHVIRVTTWVDLASISSRCGMGG